MVISDRSIQLRLASVLSVAGHPFVLMPITVAVATRAAWLSVSLAVGTLLLLMAVIAHRVRHGRWSDHDVSDSGQRHSLYPVAIATLGTSTMLAWQAGVTPGVVWGFAVALGVLVGAAVITRWTKVSLHTMWGAFCASVLVGSGIEIALVFGAFVACLGWSRVVLGRHTLGQVVIGGALGCLGGGLVVLNKDCVEAILTLPVTP